MPPKAFPLSDDHSRRKQAHSNPTVTLRPGDDVDQPRPSTTLLHHPRRRRRLQRGRMISEQAIEQPSVFASIPIGRQGADRLSLQSSPFVANETVNPRHLLGTGRSREIR